MAEKWWEGMDPDPLDWRPPTPFDPEAIRTYDRLIDLNDKLADDWNAQALFYVGMYDMEVTARERDYAYQQLIEYLMSEYDINFVAEFDWEEYREWYETQ